MICTILFLLFNACQQSENLKQSDKERISKDIKIMLEDYHTDINRGGLMAEFKYLDESDDFFWVPPGYTSPLNYDSVKTILTANAKGLESVQFSWNTLKVFPLSHTIANYTGIVNGAMKDTSGIVNSMRIIESGTLVKRSTGWKLLNGQSAVLESK